MSKIGQAVSEIQSMDSMANEDRWVNHIHPLVKLCITILYIATVVSFSKYNLSGLLSMAVYPVILFIVGEISFLEGVRRMCIVLPVVCVVGIFNPFFDRDIVLTIGGMGVSGGVISMVSLMIKGILTVFASYLLIASTSIEKICYALRLLHVPKMFVTQILLIYRYISVLLAEANRITQAYTLRAPGQKGVHFKVWGSLIGQLLLRSMDRADDIYESMCLRGYHGEFYDGARIRFSAKDGIYLIVWLVMLFTFRFFPVMDWIGELFV